MKKYDKSSLIRAFVAGLVMSFASFAVAQSDAVRAIYESAASVPTNVAGIRTFPAPPAAFDPLSATDEALASYGFPPRPDRQTDAHGNLLWQRAMTSAKKRWTGNLKPHPEAMSHPAVLKNAPTAGLQGSGAPITLESVNWSGVANTNTLTKWNAKTSFGYVYSQFNVPVVQQPFDVCDGYYDWEVTWNGIDGAKDGTVLQGGSSSQAYCNNNKTAQYYFAWVEWYPSYPIEEVFPVNPGDDVYVATYDTSGGCNPGFVYVEDETTLSWGTYQLNWLNGPCLIGNSAEIIVERPYGDDSQFYPLANYIWDFALSWDYNLKGTENGPGATSASTYIFEMADDDYTQVISVPVVEGKYSVFFYDTGCAYTGGCVF
jgi:hypothetical protein